MEKDFTNTEFWTYPDEELDNILVNFRFKMRSNQKDENGEFQHYSLTSLQGLRNALTRELVKHNRNIDLTNDPAFKKSQSSFKDASKELKRIGKGVIHSYPEIIQAGLSKALSSPIIISVFFEPFHLQVSTKSPFGNIYFLFQISANCTRVLN